MGTFWNMKSLILFLVLGTSSANAAVCSRTMTFGDGSILTAAQLNAEFNAITNCSNSLNDDNISTSASILPSKLNSTIAGDGIARDGATGVLSVGVDGSTIEINSDALRVKDAGITGAKLNSNAADASTLEVAGGWMRVKDSGIVTAKILDANVTTAKIADGAVTQAKREALNIQTSAGCGNYATSSATWVDVTNQSVSITTTGRPVVIQAISQNDATFHSFMSGNCQVRIMRDASQIALIMASTSADNNPTSSVSHIDSPAAGTYTYKVQAQTTVTCNYRYTKLVAYEL